MKTINFITVITVMFFVFGEASSKYYRIPYSYILKEYRMKVDSTSKSITYYDEFSEDEVLRNAWYSTPEDFNDCKTETDIKIRNLQLTLHVIDMFWFNFVDVQVKVYGIQAIKDDFLSDKYTDEAIKRCAKIFFNNIENNDDRIAFIGEIKKVIDQLCEIRNRCYDESFGEDSHIFAFGGYNYTKIKDWYRTYSENDYTYINKERLNNLIANGVITKKEVNKLN